ncbi:hypothetical protein [Streptomyces sp. C1-2]|uniref:hypothetical protein n=1 Tax=Streptomyces sp. C1-2 TaxID=2720022 RepID=UPI0014324D7D|nr:hypothetical protein [Streptomyces sp. C1-2]NJP69524.1 hypothetical protein [Streptomyces sp. C1-2]
MLASTPFFGLDADVLVSALVGAATVVGTILTLRHYRQVMRYARRVGRTTENATELQETTRQLRTLAAWVSEYAQRPCGEEEFNPVTRARHRLCALAAESGLIAPELHSVVGCLDRWLATALPPADTTPGDDPEKHRASLVGAMRQEDARGEVERSVTLAQTRIRTLSRAH